ncbi:MAG: geranylgeranylglycerol-phosphate geranylgeranyltransferase [Niabella sp.]
MALIQPFMKLIRWPNLLFIVLTQVLFEFCIYHPIYKITLPAQDIFSFLLLVAASVFIAAAGYIINDYFDINIDLINKPQKMILGKALSRRWALAWHLTLSGLGIICTAIAVNPFDRWYLVIANMVCVVLLWFYSARFKKDILTGNIIVSLLTAWTIMIIFLSKYSFNNAFSSIDPGQIRLFRFAMLYSGFAFVISLIREAIKDIEDMPGDEKFGCRTLPIAWGIQATKVYVAVWLTILIVLLVIIQFYVLQFRWWLAMGYCIIFIIIPLMYIFRKLMQAAAAQDYHKLSNLTKGVMLTGILSMLFFYFYLSNNSFL